MATNLGTLPVIKANPELSRPMQVTLFVMPTYKFGASLQTGGIGSFFDSSVSTQTVIPVVITDPIQYWSS